MLLTAISMVTVRNAPKSADETNIRLKFLVLGKPMLNIAVVGARIPETISDKTKYIKISQPIPSFMPGIKSLS